MNTLLYLNIIIPFAFLVLLGASFFLNSEFNEKNLQRAWTITSVLIAVLGLTQLGYFFIYDIAPYSVHLPPWFVFGDYQFETIFLVDHLSVSYGALSAVILSVIVKFSFNYLYKETGYFRFFFLIALLYCGLILVCFAGTLDILFVGWELVGTASVLLIAFFHQNASSVRNSVKALIGYRLCDMGILAASAWAHLHMHTTAFREMSQHVYELSHEGHFYIYIMIGLFIIWASLAKAAQLPFSAWLPSAMEGPTPSSAVFYGALSIHLGPYLLLRAAPFLEQHWSLTLLIGLIGGSTAIYATLVGRTRSDAKTMLAYATMTQLGVIFVEISLGFYKLALIHMMANASLRAWQFLRASSLIQDFQENPLVYQDTVIKRQFSVEKFLPPTWRMKLYIHALNEFHLDYFTSNFLKYSFYMPIAQFKKFDRWLMEINNKIVGLILRK
jgi:NADH-quinone oxidoreductase subunit L